MLGTAPVGFGPAPGFYSGNTKIRVAFTGTGANAVTYYSCKERFNNGSTRNCTAIGTGSYTITTAGDARVMTLSNPPLLASGLGYQGVFVERGGKVYSGYQSTTTTTNTAGLNLAATNALFSQLGLPAVNPDTPLALTKTSYAGDWQVSDGSAGFETVSIGNDGSYGCTNTNPVDGTTNDPCTLTFSDLTTGTLTFTLPDGTFTGTFNFMSGVASGTFVDGGGTSASISGARR